MKKIILLTGFLILAQLGSAQVNIGARLGMNAGLFEMKSNNVEKYDISPRYNVLLNLDVDVPFSLVFSFRTGIGLVQKWSEIDRTPDVLKPDTNWSVLYRMSYLEVPLFLVARAETDYYGNFYFGAGPTLGFGVGGQMIISNSQDNIKLIWGNKEHKDFNYFKRFDFGLGAVIAYQLPRSGITITASYNKGLRNISCNPDIEFRTSYVGLSVGFFMKN